MCVVYRLVGDEWRLMATYTSLDVALNYARACGYSTERRPDVGGPRPGCEVYRVALYPRDRVPRYRKIVHQGTVVEVRIDPPLMEKFRAYETR